MNELRKQFEEETGFIAKSLNDYTPRYEKEYIHAYIVWLEKENKQLKEVLKWYAKDKFRDEVFEDCNIAYGGKRAIKILKEK